MLYISNKAMEFESLKQKILFTMLMDGPQMKTALSSKITNTVRQIDNLTFEKASVNVIIFY